MAGMTPSDISIALLNFASLSSPSSLANSYIFLVGVWRIIKNLTWSTLATVPSRRKGVLFLVRLKNRRIFSLRSLCPLFRRHHFFFFFGPRKVRNLELLQSSKASGCEGWSFQGALYRRRNLGKLTAHRVQKHLNSTQIFLKQVFQTIYPQNSNIEHILH